jgi:hypothetical protein
VVELRIQFVGPEDPELAAALTAAGVPFRRSRKSALTGFEIATLTISVVGTVAQLITPLLAERFRKPDPKILLFVDGTPHAVSSSEQLESLLTRISPPAS